MTAEQESKRVSRANKDMQDMAYSFSSYMMVEASETRCELEDRADI